MSDTIRRTVGKLVDTGKLDEMGQPITYWVRARTEVLCCGNWLDCSNFTNTCECGTDYNMSGQMLAPRSQWGEVEGDQPSDCVGPFTADDLDDL